MLGYVLTEKRSKLLNAALADLLVLAEADAVFMSDYGGNMVANSASAADDDTMCTMTALAAGSFAATRELASLIGEPSFHSVFHQGQRASIYIQNITANFLVLVIFGKSTTAGLVKLYVDKASKELQPILQEMAQGGMDSAEASTTFEIDTSAKVFREK